MFLEWNSSLFGEFVCKLGLFWHAWAILKREWNEKTPNDPDDDDDDPGEQEENSQKESVYVTKRSKRVKQ
jgi:hypothetical protein